MSSVQARRPRRERPREGRIAAITGACTYLGVDLIRRLEEDRRYDKVIVLDVRQPPVRVGPGSKVAMGTLSCFFPVVLSAAAGMRQIDGVLIRVGRSFRLSTSQMVTKIYLPAMREPIVNGVRLGMGVAMIGTLLAETKLSNKGVGFMIIDAYNTFDMPRMYAALLMLFVIAIGANTLVGCASRG